MKKNKLERRIQIGSDLGTKGKVIRGYAALYNTPTEYTIVDNGREVRVREVILPGAFTPELINKSDVAAPVNHNKDIVLARSNRGHGTMSLSGDAVGLRFEFTPGEQRAEYTESVKRGDIDQCSYEYRVDEQRITPKEGYLLREIISYQYLTDICLATSGQTPQTKAVVMEQRTQEAIEAILRTQSDESRSDMIEIEAARRQREIDIMEMNILRQFK